MSYTQTLMNKGLPNILQTHLAIPIRHQVHTFKPIYPQPSYENAFKPVFLWHHEYLCVCVHS